MRGCEYRDPELFNANTFSYGARRHLAEHAYQTTRADLRLRRRALRHMFERHGIGIDDAVLDDTSRHLVARRRGAPDVNDPAATSRDLGRTLHRLDRVLDELEASLASS